MAVNFQGLTSEQAAERFRQHGPNELPKPPRRDLVKIAFEVSRQPMFALLLAAAGLYALLGEPLDAAVLTGFALLSISITIIQETRSERVLESLRSLASPRALVVRNGMQVRISGREVVPGDLMILSEGDRVPADAVVEKSHDLAVDESILTGESVAVAKRLGGEKAFAYAGTLVVRGSAETRVTATGPRTELGKIGTSLKTLEMEQPRLQRQLRWLVRDFAIFGIVVAGSVVLLLGLQQGNWLNAGLAGIAVGMSAIPEEFPLVLAVFMAMGAWRISRAGVLTRRAAAIETLGSATVLCCDKTGTMTENRMRIQVLETEAASWRSAGPLPDSMVPLLRAAHGASATRPADPMDLAIHEQMVRSSITPACNENRFVRGYGLRPDLFAMANVWSAEDGTFKIYAKGAPEAVADLSRVTADERAFILKKTNALAQDGFRVLAVAEGKSTVSSLPDRQEEFSFRYLGLVGFADPLRAQVPEAIAQCHSAGIRIVMITGDYPVTAQSIARQAGLDCSKTMTGDVLDSLSNEDLAREVREVSVFSRIRPAQKLRIVNALKANGEIVAMTGDGVNDAPAIKAAHIGVAMGRRGTDVAREAASLVLLNDDFVSIVSTIRMGRRIYDNLRKAIQYIVAVHIPIAGLAILPLLLGLPAMLAPLQIAFLEMVIDPTCSIVFESEQDEDDIMRRPPRGPDTSILPWSLATWALLQGMAALLLVSFALVMEWRMGLPEADLRALTFTVLVASNLGLILVNRSFSSSLRTAFTRPNRALWGLVSLVLVLLSCALFLRPGRELFDFGQLNANDLALAGALGIVLFIGLELGKTLWFRHPISARAPLK
jgi:Ca2+-transporting ATPase